MIPGSHQLALLNTGVLPAGGGDRAYSLPRVTSPNRKGNTILAALHAGFAQAGRAPGRLMCLQCLQNQRCFHSIPAEQNPVLIRQGCCKPSRKGLVLVSQGKVRPGRSQLLGCCRESAAFISLLRASSSTELFLGQGCYWEASTVRYSVSLSWRRAPWNSHSLGNSHTVSFGGSLASGFTPLQSPAPRVHFNKVHTFQVSRPSEDSHSTLYSAALHGGSPQVR